MILPSLLLQKPSKTTKAKEHLLKLDERLKLWVNGNFHELLLSEGVNIQRKLKLSRASSEQDNAKRFAKLMFQGKINAAVKLLSSGIEDGGVYITN